jgi:hypothetical protein
MVTKHEGRSIEIRWDDDALVWVGEDLVTGTMSQSVTYRGCLEAVVDAVRLKAKNMPPRGQEDRRWICWGCDEKAGMLPYEVGSGARLGAWCKRCNRTWTVWGD